MSDPRLFIHAVGDWEPPQVRTHWSDQSHRRIDPVVEARIDAAWASAMSQPSARLFDGPMCRLEKFAATPDRLELFLEPTSYKIFLGANIANPQLAREFGKDVMANPVGVSAALVSSDDRLIFGRRSSWVAYYPNRLHPFAGALEPADAGDIFAAMRRELAEEICVPAGELSEMRCLGIVEDARLSHPELIFAVRCSRTAGRIDFDMDRDENNATWSAAVTPDDLATALQQNADFTPVAVATILLTGRSRFGETWFASHRAKNSV